MEIVLVVDVVRAVETASVVVASVKGYNSSCFYGNGSSSNRRNKSRSSSFGTSGSSSSRNR